MVNVTRIKFLSLAVAGALFAGGSAAYAATDCFWARDAAGQHVRDSAGQCVKSGLWNSSVPTPAACGGKMAAPAAPAAAPAPEVLMLSALVNFDTDKSAIKPQEMAELDALAAKLRSAKTYERIYVIGHADNRGDAAYNQKLSDARADAVRKYLVSKGVDANRIVPRGLGETQPVASNDSAKGPAENRRVTVEVRGYQK